MYFSLIRLRRDVSPKDIVSLGQGDGYQLHKLVWDMFSDGPDRTRDFLYRYESVKDWPTFYTVSARKPEDSSGLWEVLPKTYTPNLAKGANLSFSLRVNPIRSKRDENDHQHRHDVVMEAKNQVGFKDLLQDKRPHVATLVQETGLIWLKSREDKYGFFVKDNKDNPTVRADSYRQHKMFKGNRARPITFSSLDFNGVLNVTDPEKFINECLYKGIGPAKAFGCGLMMVRRVR
jgi:CRISPR system Cascade subunit CasE